MLKNTYVMVLLALLAGCDGGSDNDAGPIDGGGTDDAGMDGGGGGDDAGRDAGMQGACDARDVDLTLGEQQITGDTTGRASDVTLSADCGMAPSPQEILALTVPGTGRHSIELSTQNDDTMFDTVLEVRTAGCGDDTDAQCFDDVGFDTRSAGVVFADGGDVVHVIVTGFDEAEEGPWALDVNVMPESLPAITALDAVRVGDSHIDFTVSGTDAGGDAAGIAIQFLDAAGAPVVVDGEMEFLEGFRLTADGMMTFTNLPVRLDISGFATELAAITRANVQIIDNVGSRSPAMEVTIRMAAAAMPGGACDATNICPDGYVCMGATCNVPACPARTPIAVSPTATMAATTSVTGMVSPGTGVVVSDCGETLGPETLYSVAIPSTVGPVAWDLIATTDIEGTPEDADTILYVQAVCGDPESAGECVDDSGDFLRSTVEVLDLAPGSDQTIGVEIFTGPGSTAVPFALDVTLRPVLAALSPCDPMEVMNRCSTGTCTGTPSLCPAAP